jgi:hypothetical protein
VVKRERPRKKTFKGKGKQFIGRVGKWGKGGKKKGKKEIIAL